MSPQAARIEFLRKQQADLQRWTDNWPPQWSRRHALRKKTGRNLEIITGLLREQAGHLIAEGCQ